MKPLCLLGAIAARDLKSGVSFSIGTGFAADMRKSYWKSRKSRVGKIAK